MRGILDGLVCLAVVLTVLAVVGAIMLFPAAVDKLEDWLNRRHPTE